MRLKSWESPRSEGRNSKGKGGSARARQLKKRQQTLRKLLKAQNPQSGDRQNNQGKETHISFPFLYLSTPRFSSVQYP
jgi:hypothetical protein